MPIPVALRSPQLRGYRTWLLDLRDEALRLTAGLGTFDWRWKPRPSEWSVSQCIEHIALVNGLLLPRLEAAVTAAKIRAPEGPGPYRYPLTDQLFVRILAPEAGMKLPAPAIYRPGPLGETAPIGEMLMGQFHSLQDSLIACVERADGIHLARARVASPFNRLLKVSIGGWFEAIIAHERTHLAQASRVRQARDRSR